MLSENFMKEYDNLIELQKDFFFDHSSNVSLFTELLSKQIANDYPEFNIDDKFIYHIRIACLIHDIGKLDIPLEILSKPAKLTTEEFEIIKKHSIKGIDHIKELFFYINTDDDRKLYEMSKNIILYHHERNNGTGYLQGLQKDEIPIEAQIVAIIDSFDAMTTQRCYRKAINKSQAIDILSSETDKYNEKFLKSFSKLKYKLCN